MLRFQPSSDVAATEDMLAKLRNRLVLFGQCYAGAVNRPSRPLDTSDAAHDVQLEAYRRLGGAGRVSAAFGMSALVRGIAVAGIRQRHPDYDEYRVRRALSRLLWGDAIVRQIWPGEPMVDP